MRNNAREFYRDFYGNQIVSKTERFELKPQRATMDNILKYGFLQVDLERAAAYKKVKELMDNYHRSFVEQILSATKMDWSELYDAIMSYRSDNSAENRAALEKAQAKYRKMISKKFSQAKNFKEMFKADMITTLLPSMNLTEEETKAVKYFDKFSTYFTGFHENRKNLYSADDIAVSIPRRITHENFNRYVSNLTVIQKIFLKFPEVIALAKEELRSLPEYEEIDAFFTLDGYNRCLSQRGIDWYNRVEGEINKQINLYIQQEKEKKIKRREFMLQPLYKQILSEKDTPAFVNDIITDDQQVVETIGAYLQDLEREKTLEKLDALFLAAASEMDGIYLNRISLTEVSKYCFGNWAVIDHVMKDHAETVFSSKKHREDYLKRKEVPVKEIEGLLEEKDGSSVSGYFRDAGAITGEVIKTAEAYQSALNGKGGLRETKEKKNAVKALCDVLIKLLHYVKPFAVSEEVERNLEFYTAFDEIYLKLEQFTRIYNRVRNYLTKKPYSEEKCKLNFDCPTLANGWDQNKEQANGAIILIKDGKYYLGILNVKKKPKIEDYVDERLNLDAKGVYKKLIYKLLPGPNKMLPKVFFSKKGIEQFQPSQEILDGYEAGKHKKGDTFDLEFCRKLIDFFKENIEKYPGWDEFGFRFSPTESYTDISQFYKEVADQGYKIRFAGVREKDINKLVDDGSLFLFQIYNKDFAEGAKGTPNLHTLYWKALFCEENLKDVVFKLNGEAELFYRKKSIEKPFVHKKGTKLVNKRLKDGTPIDDRIYREFFAYANGKVDHLSCDAREIWEKVEVKDAVHDIIKDRRYTEDKFFFHVPITMNFKAGEDYYLNQRVNAHIKDNPDVHIIGIDRGERNLIYMSLIDQDGKILNQEEFNLMNNMDYHQKLDQRERNRDHERKSWNSIESIKDLKNGYLSQVIHKITTIMVEKNAIIVMEDLNYGFKRGRFRIEKQVYQKFERMLIEKLNYLVTDKKLDWNEIGGVLKGLQLTNQFTSFEKMGKQNGFLYYVPASYTSKIDPTTGFANIFNFTRLTNFEARKDFFSRFESIKFDEETGLFVFTFDYDKFDCVQTFKRKKWTAYSNGKRICRYREEKNGPWKTKPIELTNELKSALEDADIEYIGADLRETISSLEENQKNGKLLFELLFLFKLMMQMRNSTLQNETDQEDYIISCVKNRDGEFFDSHRDNKDEQILPCDADANGAYHIALKGKMIIDRLNGGCDEKKLTKISNEEWFEFVQTRGM